MSRQSAAVRAYRGALGLLPRGVREQDREEMVGAFTAMWEDADGRKERFLLVARSFGRLPLVMAAEWWDQAHATKGARRWRLRLRLGGWFADARYAGRRLRARPGYTGLAILTLALGVGGTAAVYGIARGLLFDPLPYANEDEIGVFWKKTDWTEEEFLHLRGETPGFDRVALYRHRNSILREGDGAARLVPGVMASSELFEVLGTSPLLGRGFSAGDDAPGAEPVVVVSYGLWRELGGEQSILGRRVVLDGTARTVVGVMPPDFWFPDPSVRIWTPVPLSPESRSWNSSLVGRVSAGRDVRTMQTSIARITALLDERFDYPAQWDKTVGAHVTPIRDDLIGPIRPALLATLGAMGLILLIACANVAALMLGQVGARSTELAVRLALGASRRRLTRQLLVEAILLATAAAVVGAALALAGFGLLVSALPLGAWAGTAAPDWTLFASAMAIAMVAAAIVVLVPAVPLWRGELRSGLLGGRIIGPVGRGGRLEGGLVVAEVALAVLIAFGAALLARSMANLYALDPGVRTEDTGVVDVMVSGVPGRSARVETLVELATALGGLPGVRSAGVAQVLPLRGGGYNMPITIEGRPDLEGASTEYRVVSPGYLETMGIEVRSGRSIGETDRRGAEPVVVINEALADAWFSGIDPIGMRLGEGSDGRLTRIIGVVGNAAERTLTDPAVPVRYVALAQMSWVDEPQSLVFSTAPGIDLVRLLDQARQRIVEVAPAVPVRQTTTASRMLDEAVGPVRQVLSLLSLVTGIALTLGAIGVYGVMLHFAGRRRREWAIRMALGSPRSAAVARVMSHGGRLVGLGIVLGFLLALVLARLLSSFLYGVHQLDPASFAGVAIVLASTGLLASFLPARSASATEPAAVLREDG